MKAMPSSAPVEGAVRQRIHEAPALPASDAPGFRLSYEKRQQGQNSEKRTQCQQDSLCHTFELEDMSQAHQYKYPRY